MNYEQQEAELLVEMAGLKELEFSHRAAGRQTERFAAMEAREQLADRLGALRESNQRYAPRPSTDDLMVAALNNLADAIRQLKQPAP